MNGKKITHVVKIVIFKVGNGRAISQVAFDETFINNQCQSQSKSQSSSSSSSGSVAGAAVAVSGRAAFTG